LPASKRPKSAGSPTKSLDEFVSKAEEWREALENFRPAAEEAAVRDEEDAQFRRFGLNGPGLMSV